MINRLISEALAAKESGDNELARRAAREALRQVQKSKDLPNRGFYLTLAKALNAHCFEREDRARLLLRRLVEDTGKGKGRGQTEENEALAFVVVASCQIVL